MFSSSIPSVALYSCAVTFAMFVSVIVMLLKIYVLFQYLLLSCVPVLYWYVASVESTMNSVVDAVPTLLTESAHA